MAAVRYVAIGDSFTEGMGDEYPDGTPRGWADLTAQGWAASLGEPIQYANLAIRGRLAWPVVEEQLEPALALRPTHLSFNGGGNDMLRPNTDPEHIADAFARVIRRCDQEGVQLIVLSGASPSGLPLAGLVRRRGDALSDAVLGRLTTRPDIIRALNWPDRELSDPSYWSADRLHMGPRGHHRVAARVLKSLNQRVPEGWWVPPLEAEVEHMQSTAYYRQHVLPWIKRRIKRTSSGDGRAPKFPDWVEIPPL